MICTVLGFWWSILWLCIYISSWFVLFAKRDFLTTYRHEADRREVPRADCPGHPGYDHHHGCSHLDEDVDSQSVVNEFLSWVNILVGLVVMVTLALRYSLHLKQLHEAEMWFSNIKVNLQLLRRYACGIVLSARWIYFSTSHAI